MFFCSFFDSEIFRELESFHMEDKRPFILHEQYHWCWWLGDKRSHGIRFHCIDLVITFRPQQQQGQIVEPSQWCYNRSDVSQITGFSIDCSTVCSVADQRNIKALRHWPFVRGIHRSPVDSPHKWPVTRKMFPLDDVIMAFVCLHNIRFPVIFMYMY